MAADGAYGVISSLFLIQLFIRTSSSQGLYEVYKCFYINIVAIFQNAFSFRCIVSLLALFMQVSLTICFYFCNRVSCD